ncbi:unnamed protein product [Ectocarpus sp. 4 AP-2014]
MKARGRTTIREAQVKRREARDLKTQKKARGRDGGRTKTHTRLPTAPPPRKKAAQSSETPESRWFRSRPHGWEQFSGLLEPAVHRTPTNTKHDTTDRGSSAYMAA